MTMLAPILVLLALQATHRDTLSIRPLDRMPVLGDSTGLGAPTVRLRTGQGTASLWLVRTRDTVSLLAAIPDSSFYWGDDLVISLDVAGNGGAAPQHDDFQWYFRRVLDSTVVFRGRQGRWEPPRSDPDWRLGSERAGGGWTVSSRGNPAGWWLRLQLDAAWFRGESGQLPAIAFRIYDDAPGGWHVWPAPAPGMQPSGVERVPARWVPVRF